MYEHLTTLDQEFIDFECERCIDEAKAWSELIVHKENSHGDLVTNYFINWNLHQYYDYYNYQDDEDFHIQAEKLFEEI